MSSEEFLVNSLFFPERDKRMCACVRACICVGLLDIGSHARWVTCSTTHVTSRTRWCKSTGDSDVGVGVGAADLHTVYSNPRLQGWQTTYSTTESTQCVRYYNDRCREACAGRISRTSPPFGCPRWQRWRRWRWFPWRSPRKTTGWPGPDQDAGTIQTQLGRNQPDECVT